MKTLLALCSWLLPFFLFAQNTSLADLEEYALKNGFSTALRPELKHALKSLIREDLDLVRYHMEDSIAKTVGLSDVTALELASIQYYDLINDSDGSRTKDGVHRIVDQTYSKHWKALVSDENQLRFYLKKANVYADLTHGIITYGDDYLVKFGSLDGSMKSRMEDLLSQESDPDIRASLNLLLNKPKTTQEEERRKFRKMLKDPIAYYNYRCKGFAMDLILEEEIRELEKSIQRTKDPEQLGHYCQFLILNSHEKLTPLLIRLLEDNRLANEVELRVFETIFGRNTPPQEPPPQTVAFYAVKGLIHIYFPETHLHFNDELQSNLKELDPKFWQQLWQSDEENYSAWTKKFYQENLSIIKTEKDFWPWRIYMVLRSKHFATSDMPAVKSALMEINNNQLVNFCLDNISIEIGDLSWLKKVELYQHNLLSLGSRTTWQDLTPMLQYQWEAYESLKEKDQPNHLYRLAKVSTILNWFYSSGQDFPKFRNFISKELDKHARQKDMSGWDIYDFQAYSALYENIKSPYKTQLSAALKLENPNACRVVLKHLFSWSKYEDLPTILNHYDDFKARGEYVFNDLEEFFAFRVGLPIHILAIPDRVDFPITGLSSNRKDSLLNQIDRWSEKELYWHYSKLVHPDLFHPSGEMDYQRARNILTFSISRGIINSYRIHGTAYLFPVIRLLEMEFREEADFLEKDACNFDLQTAYSWARFLEKKGFASPLDAPSFDSQLTGAGVR